MEVTPREVSSTNAEPMVDTVCCEETDVKVAVASRGSMESTIRQKTNNHRRGPAVEPCPGPNNGVVGVLKYVVSEVPYIVFIRCTVWSHVAPRHLVAVFWRPSFRSNNSNRLFIRRS